MYTGNLVFITVTLLILLHPSACLNNRQLVNKYRQLTEEHFPEQLQTLGLTSSRSLHKQRLRRLKETSRFIEAHNAGRTSWEAGYNKLSVMDDQEINLYRNDGWNMNSSVDDADMPLAHPSPSPLLTSSTDVTYEGTLGPAPDMMKCIMCWVFTPLDMLQYAINRVKGRTKDNFIELSGQQLVDCFWEYQWDGDSDPNEDSCKAGGPGGGMQFIAGFGLPPRLSDYPLTRVDGKCRLEVKPLDGITIRGNTLKTVGRRKLQSSDSSLYAALQDPKIGVVGANIGAYLAFQTYRKGIFAATGCTKPRGNHGFTIVGYGVEGGVGYFRARNNWGDAWGMKGYMHIKRDLAGANLNICGVSQFLKVLDYEPTDRCTESEKKGWQKKKHQEFGAHSRGQAPHYGFCAQRQKLLLKASSTNAIFFKAVATKDTAAILKLHYENGKASIFLWPFERRTMDVTSRLPASWDKVWTIVKKIGIIRVFAGDKLIHDMILKGSKHENSNTYRRWYRQPIGGFAFEDGETSTEWRVISIYDFDDDEQDKNNEDDWKNDDESDRSKDEDREKKRNNEKDERKNGDNEKIDYDEGDDHDNGNDTNDMNECKDNEFRGKPASWSCSRWKSLGICGEDAFAKFMKKNCPESCLYC